jgi:hypothetical protein
VFVREMIAMKMGGRKIWVRFGKTNPFWGPFRMVLGSICPISDRSRKSISDKMLRTCRRWKYGVGQCSTQLTPRRLGWKNERTGSHLLRSPKAAATGEDSGCRVRGRDYDGGKILERGQAGGVPVNNLSPLLVSGRAYS